MSNANATQKPKRGSEPPRRFASRKGKQKQNDEPNWLFFTKKNTAFVTAARSLDVYLKDNFGPEITISKWEKSIPEMDKLSEAERALLDDAVTGIFPLYEAYSAALAARMAERQSFRGSVTTTSLQASFTNLAKKLQDEGKSDE